MLGSSAVGSGRSVLGLLVVAVLWLVTVGSGVAQATTGHAYGGQFGGAGDGDGQFGESSSNGPSGVGVLASTGEVFTVDAAQLTTGIPAPRAQRFDAAGTFESSFALDRSYEGGGSGLAVDSGGSGALYVATGVQGAGGVPSVVKYSETGVLEYALDVGVLGTTIRSSPEVAVDPVDGTVYATVVNAVGAEAIGRFDPVSGVLLDSFDGSANSADGGFCSVTSLAVDGSHQVYVLDVCKGRVDRFGAGVYETTLALAETPSAVATDPVSGEVYVAHGGPVGTQVTHFGAGGVGVVYTFDAREARAVRAMAVSGAGTVYISDNSRPFVVRYDRFDGPTVVTGATSPPEARSVVLEGTIDPEGVSSRYRFEYGTDRKYGSRTPVVDAGSGSGAVAASAAVSGLRPNTTYKFRLVGSNDSGSIAGSAGEFTTAPAPPEVGGSAFASAIAPRSARLHGTVNMNTPPLFSFVFYHVEYGTTTAYGQTADPAGESGGSCFQNFSLLCGGDDIPVIGLASGLQPSTTYHFRVVADVDSAFSTDPQYGADQTFITAPAPGSSATGMTSRRATLTGTINPHGVATSYHFNYGPTTSYGARTPEVDAGSGDGDQQVSRDVSGLLPDTTYHVQVVATSADGVVRSGADGLFRTAPAPTAAVIGQTGVSTDAATLVGEANTFGATGSYHFDISSLDSGYASSTPERPVSGNASAERVSAVLAGLPAGETFVVQLMVTSNDSVGVSDQDTFATAAVPRIFPPAPAAAYGCGSPRLNAYGAKPKPGETIAITGQDLGVGGSVVLGDRSMKPLDWSSTGFTVLVPDDAAGTLALTVNCGHQSNTIAVAVFQEPDRSFSVVGRSVVGSTATLRVRVPGPGKIESFGANSKASKVTVKKAGTATVKVRLSSAGVRALGRASSRSLKVRARVRFTPAGGQPATKTVTVTFKRRSGR